MPPRNEDKQYLAHKANPSPETEAALYNALRRGAHKIVRRRLRGENEDLVADIASEAFLKLDQFDGRSAFSTWFFRLAENMVKMYIRSNRPREIQFIQPSALPVETAIFVREVVGSLPQVEQDWLNAILAGEEIAEIGKRYGLSPAASKSKWHRLRSQLQGKLRGATGRAHKLAWRHYKQFVRWANSRFRRRTSTEEDWSYWQWMATHSG